MTRTGAKAMRTVENEDDYCLGELSVPSNTLHGPPRRAAATRPRCSKLRFTSILVRTVRIFEYVLYVILV